MSDCVPPFARYVATFGIAGAVALASDPRSAAPLTRHIVRDPQNSSMAQNPANGIVSIPGRRSVDKTVAKLQELLRAKGVKLFALIDHSGEAEAVGLPMRPTKLLIFGNPKAGTPLMLASPTIAIDLPLKILVWEDASGKTRLSYNSPEYLAGRHGLPDELAKNIVVVESLAAAAAE